MQYEKEKEDDRSNESTAHDEIARAKRQIEAAEKIWATQVTDYCKDLRFQIPAELSKKLRSYILIDENLGFIKKIAEELIVRLKNSHNIADLVDTALWQSIIVTYSKLFTKSQTGFASLQANDCFKSRSDFRLIHENLCNLRNKFVAHREESVHESAHVFLRIQKDGSQPEVVSYRAMSISQSCPSIRELNEYLHLLEHLSCVVDGKIDKQLGRVQQMLYDLDREERMMLMVDEDYRPLAI